MYRKENNWSCAVIYVDYNYFTTGVFYEGKCLRSVLCFLLNFCTFACKMMYGTDCNTQVSWRIKVHLKKKKVYGCLLQTESQIQQGVLLVTYKSILSPLHCSIYSRKSYSLAPLSLWLYSIHFQTCTHTLWATQWWVSLPTINITTK